MFDEDIEVKTIDGFSDITAINTIENPLLALHSLVASVCPVSRKHNDEEEQKPSCPHVLTSMGNGKINNVTSFLHRKTDINLCRSGTSAPTVGNCSPRMENVPSEKIISHLTNRVIYAVSRWTTRPRIIFEL